VRVETNGQALFPISVFYVIDGGGWAFDTSVVHQHIETAQVFQRLVEPGVHLGFACHV
jgi:hypothetical protein